MTITLVTRTVLLFGGRSPEHDVSILSARAIAEAAPKERVEIVPICIASDGRFIGPERSAKILLGLPYAGSGVSASAVATDKAQMKCALAAAKLPMVDFVQVLEWEWRNEPERIRRAVNNALRLPYFVKPANGGSAVGITKVKSDRALTDAVEHALMFDDKVLVERGIDAREFEVALLGNDTPAASVPGEIVPAGEFYDYAGKAGGGTAQLIVPAKLAKDKSEELRRHALTAFKAVAASGYARVDFFLERGTNRLFVNEIDTVPGFAPNSLFPKLWEATELKVPRLIEKLIELGIERSKGRAAREERAMEWLHASGRHDS